MTPARQQHPDDLFLITREELDRCCSQMSAAGYKVSANYVEAMVLSRPAPSPDCMKCTKTADGYCLGKEEGAAQAREKLFEAIRAERDPSLDYVDWDSIEAAYSREVQE